MNDRSVITAKIIFSFKGKTFSPTSTIDLDSHMQGTGRVPDLYLILARENDIGLYSYEYEMLQAETVQIEKAEGLIADFVTDGLLDTANFETAWQEQQIHMKINQLSEKHGLEELTGQHPELKKLLFDIYQAGKQDKTSSEQF